MWMAIQWSYTLLDEPIPTEIEELLVDEDDDINDDMEYEYGNEVESDNQQDKLG